MAALLLVSGACALSYQLAWLRLLRLVFGHSTAATAAVLGIFMGGLGSGAIVLGRRADRHPNPLRLYALLEIGITGLAALTPWLIAASRELYTALGGSAELGLPGATALRLLLSVLVLGGPTFLMGGTMSAAARAVEADGEGRWRTAALYGCNTLGAVAGVLLANFVLFERFGTRSTLWLAACANALLAAAAWGLSQRTAAAPSAPATRTDCPDGADARFVLATATAAGFGFLLMELLWYRLLAPLLGGSTYTFGLILAVALLGIALGGLAYALEPPKPQRATTGRLALVTAAEAVCLIVPFAIGDRIALLTMSLDSLAAAGFPALVFVWTAIALLVVLPTAVVSGYQFPLLIALLGQRTDRVGSDVGRVYAWNTLGAIAGSLAGGFGLIPGLGALGAWRAIAVLFAALALAGAVLARLRNEARRPAILAVAAASAAVALSFSLGPTAVWRHTPIGAGVASTFGRTPNELTNFVHGLRRTVHWETDGVESAVAVTDADAFSLMINGKSDGNAIGDTSTVVMAGMLPALSHAEPRTALVIGLGLGGTAGWLAEVPSIERVDVVELEPAVLRAAADAAAVNFDVVAHPKVHFVLGDAREYLLTTKNRYDVIASEPSNPYRAGVASLFTVEFYEAARRALNPGGLFAQWVQTYAVDAATVKTVYASLATAFDSVESWELQLGADLLLLAREQDQPHSLPALEAKLAAEPYRSALRVAWGLAGLSGLYTGYVAGPAMAREIRDATPAGRRNTDDSTLIEFEFAQSIGRPDSGLLGAIREAAARREDFAPAFVDGQMNWRAVEELRPARALHEGKAFRADGFQGSTGARQRVEARAAYAAGQYQAAVSAWDQQQETPLHPIDVLVVADSLAETGDARCPTLVENMRRWSEGNAETILARYAERTGDAAGAASHLQQAFRAYRTSPWNFGPLVRRSLEMARRLAGARPESAAGLLEALRDPFAAHVLEDRRRMTFARIALEQRDPGASCASAIAALEPWVPFDEAFLRQRVDCYQRTGNARVLDARRDLEAFLAGGPATAFETGAR